MDEHPNKEKQVPGYGPNVSCHVILIHDVDELMVDFTSEVEKPTQSTTAGGWVLTEVRSKITFDGLEVEPSLKFEPMVYLSLPISDVPSVESPSYLTREVNLLDCLNQFATREELGEDDWAYCDTTRRCERSSKQLDLWTAPECLIIHLKRFAVDFATGSGAGACDFVDKLSSDQSVSF